MAEIAQLQKGVKIALHEITVFWGGLRWTGLTLPELVRLAEDSAAWERFVHKVAIGPD